MLPELALYGNLEKVAKLMAEYLNREWREATTCSGRWCATWRVAREGLAALSSRAAGNGQSEQCSRN